MKTIDQQDDESLPPIEKARAIKACLDYLQSEASELGIAFGAHMIDVAATAINDWVALEMQNELCTYTLPPAPNRTVVGEASITVLRWRQRNG